MGKLWIMTEVIELVQKRLSFPWNIIYVPWTSISNRNRVGLTSFAVQKQVHMYVKCSNLVNFIYCKLKVVTFLRVQGSYVWCIPKEKNQHLVSRTIIN